MGNRFWTRQYMEYLSTFDEDAETDHGEIAKNDALHIGEAITVHEFQYDVTPNPERTKWQWKNKQKNEEEIWQDEEDPE